MNQGLGKALYVAGVTTFCTFLGCWAVLAHQGTPSGRKANSGYTDETFLRGAWVGSTAEVKLGQLAEEKAQSEEVKKFAKRMVADHSKSTEEVKELGTREGINMPTDVSHKDALVYDRLSKLSGAEFDKAYAQDMVKDHEKDIADFKHGAASTQKAEVKQFAESTLPTLESHLQEAKQLMAHVAREGVSKGRAGSGHHR